MSFEFEEQTISGVILVKPKLYCDNRGYFLESYKKSVFNKNGIDVDFVQDNYSKSMSRVIRGLHYQKSSYAQSKLVKCLKGKIYDAVIDLRPESNTYNKYMLFELSEENNYMLFVPKTFAHGFVVVSDYAEVMYKVDTEYHADAESGIHWSSIDWGIDFEPVVSDKDVVLPKMEGFTKCWH